ncbi:bacterioferritin [Jannaschia seohaensis]|uniref:Bacterioferritin n=1 Tax=Jannaschia seohaensis TaxID=475081 RepID=A0A2Y9AQB5_9RHOB|nr:bacterioferritin [Jannaschia seohaensis]PWJ20551.1 bacterioferritin [Jannaschia seohaensis]SSA44647.1 bacterioferritin [Jannaschia seohaensis]
MSNNKTIENLNKALQMEMSATHQYQLHAHVLDDWGLNLLADKMREEQAEEVGHSDLFIERVLFLKGTPEIAFAKPPKRAETLKEMFESDLADEQDAIVFYTQAAREAYEANDVGSRLLFEKIAVDEEGHKAWLELQLDLIERIGEQAYSAKLVSLTQTEGQAV